jgi:hypothetical protein
MVYILKQDQEFYATSTISWQEQINRLTYNDENPAAF